MQQVRLFSHGALRCWVIETAILLHTLDMSCACLASADADSIEFAVDYEHRACDKLKRSVVIDTIAKAVPQPPHKVNLKAPKKTIVVQLVRNVCAVGVVEGYKELARLNLRKLADGQDDSTQEKKPATISAAATEAAAQEGEAASA